MTILQKGVYVVPHYWYKAVCGAGASLWTTFRVSARQPLIYPTLLIVRIVRSARGNSYRRPDTRAQ